MEKGKKFDNLVLAVDAIIEAGIGLEDLEVQVPVLVLTQEDLGPSLWLLDQTLKWIAKVGLLEYLNQTPYRPLTFPK